MVELSELFAPAGMDEIFCQFSANGIIFIITHPGRNPFLHQAPERSAAMDPKHGMAKYMCRGSRP